jgi:hypothetical protein
VHGLRLARQSIAQHPGLLEEANLVITQWRGREKRHFLDPVPLQDLYERWIRGREAAPAARGQPLRAWHSRASFVASDREAGDWGLRLACV